MQNVVNYMREPGCSSLRPYFTARPPVNHDCRYTNSVRSGVHPAIADAILGHGDKKKSLQSLRMTISDDDLIRSIDMMKFDTGETEIRVRKLWRATPDDSGSAVTRELSNVPPEFHPNSNGS